MNLFCNIPLVNFRFLLQIIEFVIIRKMKEFFSLCSKIRVGVQVLITSSVNDALKMAFGATKQKTQLGRGGENPLWRSSLTKRPCLICSQRAMHMGSKSGSKMGSKKTKPHLKKTFSFSQLYTPHLCSVPFPALGTRRIKGVMANQL